MILKSVYGEEIFNTKVDKLSKTEFVDLCENLQNGVQIQFCNLSTFVLKISSPYTDFRNEQIFSFSILF